MSSSRELSASSRAFVVVVVAVLFASASSSASWSASLRLWFALRCLTTFCFSSALGAFFQRCAVQSPSRSLCFSNPHYTTLRKVRLLHVSQTSSALWYSTFNYLWMVCLLLFLERKRCFLRMDLAIWQSGNLAIWCLEWGSLIFSSLRSLLLLSEPHSLRSLLAHCARYYYFLNLTHFTHW